MPHGFHDLVPPGTNFAQAARELGIEPDYLYKIFAQKEEPGAKLVIAICKRFPRIKKWMLKPSIWPKPLGPKGAANEAQPD